MGPLSRALLLCALVAGAVGKSDVLTINDVKGFEKAVAEHPFLVVDFYAPWCGHCKKLEPEWLSASAALKKAGVPVTLAKVDATLGSAKPLAERFEVKGYPTLKMFRGDDTPLEYSGPRESAGIVSYLSKQAGPTVTPLTTEAAVAAALATHGALVVGVFAGGASDAFAAAAASLRDDFTFVTVPDGTGLPGAVPPPAAPAVLLLKTYDEAVVVASPEEAATGEALSAWALARGLPRVAQLGNSDGKHSRALKAAFESVGPRLIAFHAAGSDHEAPLLSAVSDAAAAQPSIKFITAEAGANPGALSFFALTASDVPALVVQSKTAAGADAKYVSKQAGADQVESFLAAVVAGEVTPTVKSEDAPVPNDGPVTILTANNLNDVLAPGVTALIEFYAPWCGHCKKLAPIFDEVGAHFASQPSVVIAKMDHTANDLADARFVVKGFPTLYLLNGDGSVALYDGERTASALIAFVEKHHTAAAAAPAPAPAEAEESAAAPPAAEAHDEL